MDIPKDIVARAMLALMVPESDLVESVARFILAERKRCAEVARKDCRTALAVEHDYKPTWYVRALEIADKIESGEQP